MFQIKIETQEVRTYLKNIENRIENLGTYFRHVTRPFLLRQFGIEYRNAGVGVETGRLLSSLVDSRHPEHISEITDTSITEGTRVPYAVYVENRNPLFDRIARSGVLAQFTADTLQEFLLDE